MKGNGMVRDVLDPSALSQLVGSMGIGHGEHFFPNSMHELLVAR